MDSPSKTVELRGRKRETEHRENDCSIQSVFYSATSFFQRKGFLKQNACSVVHVFSPVPNISIVSAYHRPKRRRIQNLVSQNNVWWIKTERGCVFIWQKVIGVSHGQATVGCKTTNFSVYPICEQAEKNSRPRDVQKRCSPSIHNAFQGS